MFHISHNGKKYCVVSVKFKNCNVPVIFNGEYERVVAPLWNNGKEHWRCNSHGIVSIPISNGIGKIKLHHLIMSQCNVNVRAPIIHINKIGIDNRIENLMYDTKTKNTTRNTKKKMRTILLPESTGITPNDIPSYVWYVAPEGSHGERFVVRVGNKCWKTTSSKKITLKQKLETAKSYLRKLKQDDPSLFHRYSMNGDYNATGRKLLRSFYCIIKKAGFDNIKKITIPNSTKKYLCSSHYHSDKNTDNQ